MNATLDESVPRGGNKRLGGTGQTEAKRVGGDESERRCPARVAMRRNAERIIVRRRSHLALGAVPGALELRALCKGSGDEQGGDKRKHGGLHEPM